MTFIACIIAILRCQARGNKSTCLMEIVHKGSLVMASCIHTQITFLSLLESFPSIPRMNINKKYCKML